MGEARRDAGAAAAGEDGVVKSHALASGEDDQGQVVEGGPGDGAAGCERVIGADDDTEGFFTEKDGLEAEAFMAEDWTGDGGGETALGDHFPDALGGSFLEVDGDPGEALSVMVEEAAEEGLGGGADVTQPQLAFLAGCGAFDA